jgi:hypothetical protein
MQKDRLGGLSNSHAGKNLDARFSGTRELEKKSIFNWPIPSFGAWQV